MCLKFDGRFKKVLFDEDMIKSNRSSQFKIKNNITTIDSFVLMGKEFNNINLNWKNI